VLKRRLKYLGHENISAADRKWQADKFELDGASARPVLHLDITGGLPAGCRRGRQTRRRARARNASRPLPTVAGLLTSESARWILRYLRNSIDNLHDIEARLSSIVNYIPPTSQDIEVISASISDPAKAPEFLKDVYRSERIRRRKEGVTWVTVDCDCGHSRLCSPRPLWVCSTGNGGGSA
jgi:hypothetical protein